jgi:hypothetical protein
MTEIKDILYYGTVAYLGCSMTYCAIKDLYLFIKQKRIDAKNDNLEFKLNPDNDIYI